MPNRKVYGIQFCGISDNYTNLCNCDEEILLYNFDMNLNDPYPDNCIFISDSNYHIGEILHF